MASTTYSSPACIVTTMIPRSGYKRFILRVTSMPSMSFISISTSTMSGLVTLRRSRASSPLFATPTTSIPPFVERRRANDSPNMAWSSMISTLHGRMTIPCLPIRTYRFSDGRSALRRAAPVMLVHEAVEWYPYRHARARVFSGRYIERGIEQFDPLLQEHETEVLGCGPSSEDPSHIEPDPVILNHSDQFSRLGRDPDACLGCLRVLARIVQGFLHNPEQGNSGETPNALRLLAYVKLYRQPEFLLKAAHEGPQTEGQTPSLGPEQIEAVRDLTEVPTRLLNQFRQVLQFIFHGCGVSIGQALYNLQLERYD